MQGARRAQAKMRSPPDCRAVRVTCRRFTADAHWTLKKQLAITRVYSRDSIGRDRGRPSSSSANMPTIIPDSPIAAPEDDELGRSVFANSIADLILSAPTKSSLRLGVYGGWGEGKTSVLKLVERKLRAEGHCAVWIAPWATSSRDELLDDLLVKIAAEVKLDVKSLRNARRSADVTRQLREAARADIKLRLPEILFGRSVEGHFSRVVDAETAAVFRKVEEVLAERKLVVFVDDVDRISPEVVPQLLLTLREALDHPSFFYVLALAPDIVEQGLSQVHEAWGSRKQFLEKIVELPLSTTVSSMTIRSSER